MPVYDLSYQRWEGQYKKGWRAWPILRESFLYGLRTKFLKISYMAAWLPCLFTSAIIFFKYKIEAAKTGIPIETVTAAFDREYFYHFQSAQFFIMAIFVTLIGPGLVAEDRKANALELYLSRPITRWDYFFGKVGALIFFLLSVTLAPGLLLWCADWMMAPDISRLHETWAQPFRLLAQTALFTTATATYVVAISSLTRSPGFGIIYWVASFFASLIVGEVLFEITHNRIFALISCGSLYDSISRAIYGMPANNESPHWSVCLFVVLSLIAVSIGVFMRRLRGSEVFK